MTRILALVACLLTVLITGSSAFIRHAQAGLGCDGGPGCAAPGSPAGAPASVPAARGGDTASPGVAAGSPGSRTGSPGAPVAAARLLHRGTAMAVGLLVVAVALIGWSGLDRGERAAAVVASLLTVGLAWLGRHTPHGLPLVTLGNVLGGMALAAALAWIAARPPKDGRAALPASARAWAFGMLGVLAVVACLGVMISARQAVHACRLFECAAHASLQASAFDPRIGNEAVGEGGAVLLHWVHRAAAVALAVAAVLAFLALGDARRVAAVLALMALLQGLLGAMTSLQVAPLATATAHNMAATLLAVFLAAVARRATRAAAHRTLDAG